MNNRTTNPPLPCPECGFALFHPIGSFPGSCLGLYDDSRFPGRTILMANSHADHIEDMNEPDYLQFMLDIKSAVRILKQATGSKRINVSILGNTESHVHAHLIPRYPEGERYPGKSPWNDPRPHSVLSKSDKEVMVSAIRELLDSRF